MTLHSTISTTAPILPAFVLLAASWAFTPMALHAQNTAAAPAKNAPKTAEAVSVLTRDQFNALVKDADDLWRRYKWKEALPLYQKIYQENEARLSDNDRLTMLEKFLLGTFGDEYKKMKTLFDQAPLQNPSAKVGKAWQLIRSMNYHKMLDKSEALYQEYKDRFNYSQNLSSMSSIGLAAAAVDSDLKRFQKYFDGIRNYKAPAPPAPASGKAPDKAAAEKLLQQVETQKKRELVGMIQKMIEINLEEGIRLFESNRNLLDQTAMAGIYKNLLNTAVKNDDRAFFDKQLALLQAMPLSNDKINALCAVAEELKRKGSMDLADGLMTGLLAQKDLTPEQKIRVMHHRLYLYRDGLGFHYGFHTPDAYPKWKKLSLELLKTQEALQPGKPNRQILTDIFRMAYDFGDYAYAQEQLDSLLKIAPGDRNILDYAINNALRRKDFKAAEACCSSILEDKRLNQDQREFYTTLLYFLQGGDCKGFDAKFADQKYSSEKKLSLLRKISQRYFQGKRFEEARAVTDYINSTMFKAPRTDLTYSVKYVKNAPMTAEAWAKSPFYGKWELMETRFIPYGNGYNLDHKTDVKFHLKDAPEIPLDPARMTGIHMIFDEEGFHIFIQGQVPNIQDVKLGKDFAESLEMLLRPGQDKAYHSWYLERIPANADPHQVNWATPSRNYRNTYEMLKCDTTLTNDGYVAHTFIPWLSVYDRLPVDGNVWCFGVQAWKANRTISGLVHELERALKLRFEFTPKQLTDLKRNLAIAAFNRYNAVRRNGGAFIQTWNDPLLGDPEFYKAELAPLLEELDKAGEQLLAPAPDSQIDEIYAKYVPLWAEIQYEVADRRSKWLRDSLMK